MIRYHKEINSLNFLYVRMSSVNLSIYGMLYFSVLNCRVPLSSQILHGTVRYQGSEAAMDQFANYNEEIDITCDNGFSLSGNPNPTCGADRRFTELPVCEGKYMKCLSNVKYK